MAHPDRGQLLALQDGEVTEPEAGEIRLHLDACPSCRAEAQALESASLGAAEALARLDSTPRTEAVRARISQSRGKGRSRARSGLFRFLPSLSLPRAASIALILTGVAASALPGSPVRRWLVDLLQSSDSTPVQGTPVSPPDESEPASQEYAGPGAGIPAASGTVEIWIHDLPSDADLRVRWTDGDEAWIFAGEETRFNLEAGRIEAFSPTGPVVVEIPRNLNRVVVGLDGSVLLRKSGEEVEILGPIQHRTPTEILFHAPGNPNQDPA